ncbi:MAG: ABC transporter permease [Chloroflexi bacterium]|nr:ABC transporter permease [Chloroflexota bacterium]
MLHEEAQQPALGPRRQSNPSYWAISFRRLLRKKIGVACLTVILLMYGSGILAPLVTPYGFNDQDLTITKQGPSISHPFGTDRLGRDILTRIIYGLRTTVIITVVTLVTGSLAIGITAGLVAGYFGKLIDTFIMRVGEVSSAFPEIFLVLIIVSTFKAPITEWVREVEDVVGFDIVSLGVVDYLVLSLALAIFSWFGMARLVRGQVLQARENQYVEAARSIGASTPRVLMKHVLPNVMGPVIVMVSAGLAGVAGSEIFLSFLGIGIQPPTPSLGLMIFENGSISVLRSNPHLLLFPVLTLSVLLFTFNLLGDSVNDAFNPRAR